MRRASRSPEQQLELGIRERGGRGSLRARGLESRIEFNVREGSREAKVKELEELVQRRGVEKEAELFGPGTNARL